ncbi:3-dehydroquinate synthase II [Deltaproteobacteria bacterium]|nr:3-dehydroquinate synthase II [Deltaproteobacteria bacterium]
MQVWIDCRHQNEPTSKLDGIDFHLSQDNSPGPLINVDNQEGQNQARALIGSAAWLIIEMADWVMIPLENLVAAADGGPTKIAACINSIEQAQGAAHALQIGVDALIVKNQKDMVDAALIAKSQRLENSISESQPINKNHGELIKIKITEVKNGGLGDRVCLDLTSLLEISEGLLIGSSSASMVLVHGETLQSEFVPTRPFRVNAGAVHGYVLMADGSTQYLSELKAGDLLRVQSANGKWRSASLGRLKIERRPLILLRWIDENDNEAQALFQQAETVRLVDTSSLPKSITDIAVGEKLLAWSEQGARHIGIKVNMEIEER